MKQMKTLTKAEEQIMQAVWSLGQGFLKDVVEALPEPRPHPNTVATILKILIEKEFVTFEAQGRNNLYKPLVSREDYAKGFISKVMKTYFEGSPVNLVSHFVNENKISVKELEELLEEIKKSKVKTKK